MTWKPEVLTGPTDGWTGNGLCFESKADAQRWVEGLAQRWYAVRQVRVVESTEPANYRLDVDGNLMSAEKPHGQTS